MAHFPRIFDFLFAIPNGGKRNKFEAYRLKLQGVKAGVSDLFLALPLHGKHGLFMEMKSAEGSLTRTQKAWCELMELVNYAVVVPYSFDEARQGLIDYVAGYKNASEDVLREFALVV